MSEDGKIVVTTSKPLEIPPDYRVMTSNEIEQIERLNLEVKSVEHEVNRWAAEEDLARVRQELATMKRAQAMAKMQQVQIRGQAINDRLQVTGKDDIKKIDGRWFVRVKPQVVPADPTASPESNGK